jgi:hypothetical protein
MSMPGLRCEGGSGVDVGPRVCRDAKAVGYANDTKRHLSATPSTPIEAVAGVGDRRRNLSAMPTTPLGV